MNEMKIPSYHKFFKRSIPKRDATITGRMNGDVSTATNCVKKAAERKYIKHAANLHQTHRTLSAQSLTEKRGKHNERSYKRLSLK